jgi:hypothetical protein
MNSGNYNEEFYDQASQAYDELKANPSNGRQISEKYPLIEKPPQHIIEFLLTVTSEINTDGVEELSDNVKNTYNSLSEVEKKIVFLLYDIKVLTDKPGNFEKFEKMFNKLK